MTKTYWKKWIKCAGVRAIKTFAQTAIATVGASALLAEINWGIVASASAVAAIISLLTSIAGLPELKEPELEEEEEAEEDGDIE